MRSVRKLCWPALSNETWNLPCSKELGRHRNEVGWWEKGLITEGDVKKVIFHNHLCYIILSFLH